MHLDAWGQTPHLCQQSKMTIQGPGPSFMVALPGVTLLFNMLSILLLANSFKLLCFSIILKVRFRAALSGIFLFFQFNSVAIAQIDSHSDFKGD